MAVELHVIRASEFIRLDAHEQLNLEESKAALEALARACLKRGIGCALVDLRALPTPIRPRFTLTELAELVLTFHHAGFSSRERLAILCPHDLYGGARDFAFISRLEGLKVQTFVEFEGALSWLSEEPGSGPPTRQGERSVPISLR